MQLSFLGAAREVGRSAALLETKKSKVVFDYGMKMAEDRNSQPQFPLPVHGFLDAVVLSHAHLDHSGGVPYLFQAGEPRVLTHTATVPITQLLLNDSLKIARLNRTQCFTKAQLKRMLRNTDGLSYGKDYTVTSDLSVKMHDAGHILGASIVEAEAEGKTIVYSGDVKSEETHLHSPAQYPKKADAVIVEATYGMSDHPPRKQLEKEFIASIREVTEAGGSVLLPCFAVGRTQEIITMLYAHRLEVPVYMDGMSRAVTEIYLDFPELIRDYEEFYEAMKWANWIVAPPQRNTVFNEPSVVVSTAGMLSGGPAVRYVQDIKDLSKSAVFFTGFQVPGTPGNKLLNEHRLEADDRVTNVPNLDVRHFDFSAHSGVSGLHKMLKSMDPSAVFVNHGEEEQCDALRQWAEDELGCYAFAPRLGEKYKLEDYL
ncbi:MBL fold metallo-hydrolase [archaeon]